MEENHKSECWPESNHRMNLAYENWIKQCNVPDAERTQINFLWWAVLHLLESESRRVSMNNAIASAVEDLIELGQFDSSQAT